MGALLPRRDQESEGSAWSRRGSGSWPAFHLSPCSPQGQGQGQGQAQAQAQAWVSAFHWSSPGLLRGKDDRRAMSSPNIQSEWSWEFGP